MTARDGTDEVLLQAMAALMAESYRYLARALTGGRR
jgi:hypothetical protein